MAKFQSPKAAGPGSPAPKLPDPASVGAESPEAKDLTPFFDLTIAGHGRFTETDAAKVLLPKQQVAQIDGAVGYLIREIADTNKDGQISVGELAIVSYRADQMGDRDGKISVGEYSAYTAAAYGQYVMKRAVAAGVKPEVLSALEARLATGAVGASGPNGLTDAYDVSQSDRSDGGRMLKLGKAAAYLDAFLGAVKPEQRADATRIFAEEVANHGRLPVTLPQADGAVVLGFDGLRRTTGKDGVLEYRYELVERPFVPATAGNPAHLGTGETTVASQPFRAVPDDKYRFRHDKPNPIVDRLSAELKRDVLADKATRSAAAALESGLQKSFDDPRAIQRLIDPLNRAIQKALKLDPAIPLRVELQHPESPQHAGAYMHPQPGTGAKPQIEIYLAPRLRVAIGGAREAVAAGAKPEDATAKAMRSLFSDLIGTLVEENIHALQHRMTDKFRSAPDSFPENERGRLSDYALNRSAMIDPIDLRAFFGNESLYLQQPFEADAKRVREEIVSGLTSPKR